MQAEDVLAAYHTAIAEDDRAGASRLLETLEDEAYRNEAAWNVICAFCDQQGFKGRLELITKKLVRQVPLTSAKPILVLMRLLVHSGRVSEARPYMAQYKRLGRGTPAEDWEFVNLLYEIESFAECLEVVRAFIEKDASQFPYLIMEARALWKLDERNAAKKKHRELVHRLGNDSGKWLWYSAMALEFEQPELANKAILELARMLERGDAKISKDAVFVLENGGHGHRLPGIIRRAEPGDHSALPELADIFEVAVSYGAYQTALKFGEAILAIDGHHLLRPQIEQLAAGPGFLMT
jgi:hypothetical protein